MILVASSEDGSAVWGGGQGHLSSGSQGEVTFVTPQSFLRTPSPSALDARCRVPPRAPSVFVLTTLGPPSKHRGDLSVLRSGRFSITRTNTPLSKGEFEALSLYHTVGDR